jgi:RNA-directed DNA polymerase
MLKSDIMKDMELTPSPAGTPQGGVISPMLANVALTSLDNEIKRKYATRKGMNPIVRYADDFVITAISRNHAEHIKSHIKAFLKAEIGLQLSDEKTHITEISEGFNFLGFNYRKYGEKLLIKPAKDNVLKVRRNIRETFKTTDSLVGLISKLNPIITGWGNYYRHVISKSIFGIIDQEVYEMTMTWLRNKHGRKSAIQMRRYFRTVGKDTINLHDEDTGITLLKMKKIPIKRFVKVKDGMRVYDSNAIEYWKKREYTNARNSIYGSYNLTTLFRQQKGRCGYCSQPITDEQVREATIHTHHLRPRSEGGDDKLGNLKLVHAKCHISLHSQVSRNDMARYISNGIDYLRLIKPAKR